MNKNRIVHIVLKVMLGMVSVQSSDLFADEKLNLYDRNQRQVDWQQEQDDYYPQNDYYRGGYYNRQYDYQPYGQDDYNRNTYQQRGRHRTISEPPQPPPEFSNL